MVDYLESLERLAMPDELHIKECEKLGIGLTEDFDIVEQALLELKSIKEASPSEALECLEKVYSRLPQWDLSRNVDQCNIIKQALLKAQEPKHYLKWEDLKFKEEEQIMKVSLNGSKYQLSYFTDGITEYVDLLTDGEKLEIIGRYVDASSHEKQFFNDLRLERALE